MITSFTAILIILLLIGFVNGVLAAFGSANKFGIELNKKQGTYSGKLWGSIVQDSSKFYSGHLLFMFLLIVSYGLIIGDLLFPLWELLQRVLPGLSDDNTSYIKILVEIILAALILCVVIFACSAVFKAMHTRILSNGIVGFFVKMINAIFGTVGLAILAVSEWMLKYLLNVKVQERRDMFKKMDAEGLSQQNKTAGEQDSQDKNKDLFENALNIGETRVRECLVPRKEIVRIEKTATMAEVKKAFVDTRMSKLVVYEQNIDNIVGYVHQLDLFTHPTQLEDILHPIPAVPDSMAATDLMSKLSLERKSIAWVIDEFGGTAGIITMEDLLEELFGEIKDEYDDVDQFIDKQIAEEEYIFSGRLELDFIREKYDLQFVENGEAETLSGYIIEQSEKIPLQNDRIIIGKHEFNIIDVNGTRIETVKMKLL